MAARHAHLIVASLDSAIELKIKLLNVGVIILMASLEEADQQWIDHQLASGKAILFLGSGASVGSSSENGERPLSADELRNQISDAFLDGKMRDRPLAQVAEIAKSSSTLTEVQEFIAKKFSGLLPAEFHKLIPTFRWHAIVTTNYDLVVERAYQSCEKPLQEIAPVIKDGDLRRAASKVNTVPLLKVHGCVTQIDDPAFPLILASEEYAKHRRNREQIFRALQDWAKSHPIVFCGYDISDPNISQILWDIGDTSNDRPRYVTVNPGLIDLQMSYWRDRRILPIAKTFSEFLIEQDQKIPLHKRTLGGLSTDDELSLTKWIPSHEKPTETLLTYLQNDLVHVFPEMRTEGVKPKQFYSGLSQAWTAFSRELDVRRRVTDDIVIEAVLEEEDQGPRLFILKGHAGSGKSVTLRRIAWDAANEYEKLVFFISDGSIIDLSSLSEIYRLTKEPLLVFIDDASASVGSIEYLIRQSFKDNLPITIIAGARTNEWNIWGGPLEPMVNKSYELTNLSEREIKGLLEKLHNAECLGELKGMSADQRFSYFRLSAERQLLVALHEATNGKTFPEIIADELDRITPLEAKQLYLDICTLHRFGVNVRAGLISRTSEIGFGEFENRLFAPLQHIVRTLNDSKTRDLVYKTRHRIIANMAFESAFRDPTSRSNQIIRIIRNMNVEYESDEIAFRELIRGKTMAEAFSEKQLCDNIFDAAKQSGAKLSYIMHQRAILEMNHPDGSSKRAFEIIREAEGNALDERGVDNFAILHTKAAILQRLAKDSHTIPEKEKYRQDSKQYLKRQLNNSRTSHAHSSLASVLLDELEDKLKELEASSPDSGNLTSQAITSLIGEIDHTLDEGLSKFPSDDRLKSQEARLAERLKHERRAQQALETAFTKNKANVFVAVRLSRFYQDSGKIDQAKEVIDECLRINPTEKRAHLQYAKLLRTLGEGEYRDQIGAHLRKSFSDGDSNFEAQFWFARHQYLYGDRHQASQVYHGLKKASMAPARKRERRGFVKDDSGGRKKFTGLIDTVFSDYCFIKVLEYNDSIFAHFTCFKDEAFDQISEGTRVNFFFGFTFNGPCADDVDLVQ